MITYYLKTVKNQKLRKIDAHKVGCWIHVINPTEEELSALESKHGLELGHLKDALDPQEVPRIELEKSASYIYTRIPNDDNDSISTVPVLLIMGETFIATVSQKPLPIFDKFISGKLQFSTTQKTKMFIQLFTQINHIYNNSLTLLNKKVRNFSINLEKIRNKDIIQLVEHEQILNDFLNALLPTRNILDTLLTGKVFQLYEEDRDLVEDVFLANGQLVELCRSRLTVVKNIRDAYATIMTNNLNRVMKLFTSLTVILTIPTIVSSFYGMNVQLPFASSPEAFFIIFFGTMMVTGSLVALFFKMDWL